MLHISHQILSRGFRHDNWPHLLSIDNNNRPMRISRWTLLVNDEYKYPHGRCFFYSTFTIRKQCFLINCSYSSWLLLLLVLVNIFPLSFIIVSFLYFPFQHGLLIDSVLIVQIMWWVFKIQVSIGENNHSWKLTISFPDTGIFTCKIDSALKCLIACVKSQCTEWSLNNICQPFDATELSNVRCKCLQEMNICHFYAQRWHTWWWDGWTILYFYVAFQFFYPTFLCCGNFRNYYWWSINIVNSSSIVVCCDCNTTAKQRISFNIYWYYM